MWYERTDVFYDLHVPGEEHYMADGLWSHNTGKTYLARIIAATLPADLVIFAAYTGKAAHVLRGKGCVDAQTLHSLIYMPRHPDRIREAELAAEAAAHPNDFRLAAALATERRRNAEPHFELDPDAELGAASLLIVDEVSMVGDELAEDLLSFGVPVLVLGDPEQLPPIGGPGALVDVDPDVMLTEIHRQAAGSPIIRLATEVRATGVFPAWCKGALTLSDMPWDAQIIVGRNATRWALVHHLRALRGKSWSTPGVGDRVMILKNNREMGVFNGQQLIVLEHRGVSAGAHHLAVMTDDPIPQRRLLSVFCSGFQDLDGERAAGKHGFRGQVAAATWAEAITGHKAQGSQWRRVAVVDEGGIFGRDDPRTPGRWRYSAVTRASQQVVVADWWS